LTIQRKSQDKKEKKLPITFSFHQATHNFLRSRSYLEEEEKAEEQLKPILSESFLASSGILVTNQIRWESFAQTFINKVFLSHSFEKFLDSFAS
jgi:hypothetical protein